MVRVGMPTAHNRASTGLLTSHIGMLYAEHILRQFSTIAREPLILKHLAQSMPENIDQLYETILVELQRRITPSQYPSLKTLLAWLAFSREPLALGECLGLLKLLPGESVNLEEELQGQQLSRLLKIGGIEERSDNTEEPENPVLDAPDPDSAYDDSALPLKFQGRSMRGFSEALSRTTAACARLQTRPIGRFLSPARTSYPVNCKGSTRVSRSTPRQIGCIICHGPG